MVDRFLQWKLPENFNPDGGITFKRMRNESTPYPAVNEPVGTNLLDANQSEEMVRYMVVLLPSSGTAEGIFNAVMHNLNGRSGYDNLWDSLDEDIKQEIETEIVEVIQHVMDTGRTPIGKVIR